MKSCACVAMLVQGLAVAAPATAGVAPDFTTGRGMQKTCETFGSQAANRLRGNAEKAAYVICRDIALVERIAGFAHRRLERNVKWPPFSRQRIKLFAAMRNETI